MPLVGEDRARTESGESRDRPGDEMARLNVAEAARRLGISEDGIRKRVQRGQIPHERDDDGRLFVWVSPGETRDAVSHDRDTLSHDVLVEELRAHNTTLREQLEAERQAHAEARRSLAAALERIPAIEAPSKPPGTPTEAATDTERAEPHPAGRETQEPSEALGGPGSGTVRGSWWARIFRG
jgi:hypothetical protein